MTTVRTNVDFSLGGSYVSRGEGNVAEFNVSPAVGLTVYGNRVGIHAGVGGLAGVGSNNRGVDILSGIGLRSSGIDYFSSTPDGDGLSVMFGPAYRPLSDSGLWGYFGTLAFRDRNFLTQLVITRFSDQRELGATILLGLSL